MHQLCPSLFITFQQAVQKYIFINSDLKPEMKDKISSHFVRFEAVVVTIMKITVY